MPEAERINESLRETVTLKSRGNRYFALDRAASPNRGSDEGLQVQEVEMLELGLIGLAGYVIGHVLFPARPARSKIAVGLLFLAIGTVIKLITG